MVVWIKQKAINAVAVETDRQTDSHREGQSRMSLRNGQNRRIAPGSRSQVWYKGRVGKEQRLIVVRDNQLQREQKVWAGLACLHRVTSHDVRPANQPAIKQLHVSRCTQCETVRVPKTHMLSMCSCVNTNSLSPSSRPNTPAQMLAAFAAVVSPNPSMQGRSCASTNARADEISRIFAWHSGRSTASRIRPRHW